MGSFLNISDRVIIRCWTCQIETGLAKRDCSSHFSHLDKNGFGGGFLCFPVRIISRWLKAPDVLSLPIAINLIDLLPSSLRLFVLSQGLWGPRPWRLSSLLNLCSGSHRGRLWSSITFMCSMPSNNTIVQKIVWLHRKSHMSQGYISGPLWDVEAGWYNRAWREKASQW